MTALELFKRAGIEDYLQSGAIGAGLGAAGMGAASYLGGSSDDKNRGKNALKDALKGALLGGVAGAGYEGVKGLGNHLLSNSAERSAQDFAAGRPELDTRPYSRAHPIESTVANVANIDPIASAGFGGALGVGLEKLKRNAGSTILNSTGLNPLNKGDLSKLPTEYNNILKNTGSITGIKDAGKLKQMLVSSLGNTNAAKGKALEQFLLNSGADLGDSSIINALKQGPDNDQLKSIMEKLTTAKGNPAAAAGGIVDNAIGNVDKTLAGGGAVTRGLLNRLAQYGKAGLGGMLAGGVGQLGVGAVTNAAMNTKYSPEQLHLWNQLSNR